MPHVCTSFWWRSYHPRPFGATILRGRYATFPEETVASFGRSFHVISKNSTLVMGWFMAHEDELVPWKPGGYSGSRPPQWDNGAGGGSSWPRVLSEAWLRHRCSALLGPWLHLQTHTSMQCLPHSARCRLGIVQKSASKPMIALDFEPPCNNDRSSHL